MLERYHLPLVILLSMVPPAPIAAGDIGSQHPDDAKSAYRTGVERYAQRHYRDAVAAFKKAIELDPDYAEAYRELGNSYFSLGKHWEAYEGYVNGLRLHDDSGWTDKKREWFEARIRLAVAYSIIGNRLGVVGIFSTEIRNAPQPGNDLIAQVNSDGAAVYLYLGEAYFGCVDSIHNRPIFLNAAVESFNRAIAINRRYTEAYVFRGRAYAGLNKPQEAIQSYNRAIHIDPKYADTYYDLGSVYLDLKDRESALRQYRILRRLDPKMAKLLYQLLQR